MKKWHKENRNVRKRKSAPNFTGQHLLHDKSVINKIIGVANVNKSDTVIEVGPGKGALTIPLAQRAGRLIAVEIDANYTKQLQLKTVQWPHVTIVEKNFLDFHLPRKSFIVVANIPYAITTRIIDKLVHPHRSRMQKAVLMVEEGAAKRFTDPRTTDPRLLAWHMYYEWQIDRLVSRTCFKPMPRVDSAILIIKRKKIPLDLCAQYDRFVALARHALQQPYLPAHHALQDIFTAKQMTYMFREAQIDRWVPIASLHLRAWEIIFATMLRHVEKYRWPKIR